VGLRLANVAEGAGPDAHAYLSELLDLHQSLDWEAAGPYLARRVGGGEGEAPRAFFHCDKRLVAGRIGLREGLDDLAYPYSAGVTATSPPPESGWGAPGASVPQQRKRTRGTAERPPARGVAVRRTTRAGASPVMRSGRPTFAPPGVPYYPALGAGQSLSWGYVTPRCAHALATTYPSAAGALRAAHGEAIVASLVDTLAWVTRGAGAILRDSSSPPVCRSRAVLGGHYPRGHRVPDGLPLGGARPAGGGWASGGFGVWGPQSGPVRRGACWFGRALPWGRLPLHRWGVRRGGGDTE